MQRFLATAFLFLSTLFALHGHGEGNGTGANQGNTETWVLQGYAVGKNAGNESGGVSMADVILLDSGIYRMYYDQMAPTGFIIKYAESTDGVNWSVKGTVLEGSSDPNNREYSVKGPSVLKLPDGRYRMYYQSGPQNQPMEEPKFHVRSAISNDGVNFTREGVRIEISSVDPSSPLKLAGHGTYFIAKDGTYVGIFSGNFKDEMGPSELVMATSPDGLAFSNFARLYEDWHDPIVIKVNNGYRMYATYLLEKQGTAFSSDGLTWPSQMEQVAFTDSNGNVLTEGSHGVGDIGGVVLSSGGTRLFSNYGNPSDDIVYYDADYPTLALGLNQSSFRSGNTLILTATVTPGATPRTVEVYGAVSLPDGTLLFYPTFTTDIRPLLTNWTVTSFSGEIFRYFFRGAEPSGSYTWWAAFTEPGTLTLIGFIASAAFSFSP